MASISVFDSPQVAGEGTASIRCQVSAAGAHSVTHYVPWTGAGSGRTDKIVGPFDPEKPPPLEAEWEGSTRIRRMAACVVGVASASPDKGSGSRSNPRIGADFLDKTPARRTKGYHRAVCG